MTACRKISPSDSFLIPTVLTVPFPVCTDVGPLAGSITTDYTCCQAVIRLLLLESEWESCRKKRSTAKVGIRISWVNTHGILLLGTDDGLDGAALGLEVGDCLV